MTEQHSNRFSLPLKVGTRGSALALAQTSMVIRMLESVHPEVTFAPQIISSEGDRDKTSPLTQIGGRGVFTSALQERLIDGEIDAAVHSAKDVPSLSPPGLHLAAFPDREDPRDALISRHGVSILELPANPVIGTSSRRRAVQVLNLRPDAVIRDVRGNIDTRLRKAETGDYDAIILAVAGITRMGWADRITEPLGVERFTPAPAQGAIAVEARNDAAGDLMAAIDQPSVSRAVSIERAFLRGVGGGCTTPIGAHAVIDGNRVVLHAMLADDDGTRLVRDRLDMALESAETETFALAQRMLRDVRPSWSPGANAGALRGRTVVVTGSPSQAEPLRQALAAEGADARQFDTLQILPPEEPVVLPTGEIFDWVVITSPNALLHGAAAIREAVAAGAKLAVVGRRSALAAEAAGLTASLTGRVDGASLVEDMTAAGIAGSRILCLLSNRAAPVVPDGLRAAGAEVTVITAYRNKPLEEVDSGLRDLVASGSVSAVTFASPSAAQSFMHLAGGQLAAMSGAAFVAIGNTTAGKMQELGLPVHAIAETPDPDGMVKAVCRSLGMESKESR